MLASPRVHGQTNAGPVVDTQQNGAVIAALPLSRTSGIFGDAAACGPEDPAITNLPEANEDMQIAPLAPASAAGESGQHDPWSQVKGMRAGPLVFDFSGQVRMRYERDVGFTLLGYEPGAADDLLLERVRLDLSARLWNRPRLFLQLQDSHAFLTTLVDSDFPSSSPIEDTLDIRQLYAEWLRIGGSAVGFRIGRQEISYGDQRVFGPGSWGNTGRFSWDAAMLKVDTHWFGSDLWIGKFLQYKSDVWPDRAVDEPLTVVSYTHVKRLPFRLDLFYVMKDDSSTTTAGESGTGNLRSNTIGFQAERTGSGVVDAGATVIGQFGRYGRDQIRAYGLNVKAGATAPVEWTPRLAAQYTLGSGDANPTDGTHGTFDGVYGGRDIFFYGYLNLFFWANLRDAEIDLSAKPRRWSTLFLEYHHFDLDEATDAWYTTGLKPFRRDPTGQSGTTLGSELDFRVVATPWTHIELMAGFGRFFPGGFVKKTGPAARRQLVLCAGELRVVNGRARVFLNDQGLDPSANVVANSPDAFDRADLSGRPMASHRGAPLAHTDTRRRTPS